MTENKMDEGNRKSQDGSREKQSRRQVLPPLDFSSLVLPFFSQALLALSESQGQEKHEASGSLELAKRLIDLLDLLKERTKGNLEPAETKFLESSLTQLKMAYLEKAKIIKL